jgi:predicted membrane protein
MQTKGMSSQLLFAIIIIAVGLLLLLNNLGLAGIGGLWRWIPSLFIIMGAWQLVASDFRHFTGPLILIVGGAIFQLAALDLIGWGTLAQLIWPLILIGAGLLILIKRTELGEQLHFTTQEGEMGSPEDTVRAFAMFSGADRRVTSQSFVGGEGTAVFGGVDIDLSDAAVREPPARINATALFGGIDIIVPEDWIVQMDVFGFFGGSGDERPTRTKPDYKQAADLIVTGTAMFGGVGIKTLAQK